MRRLWRHFTLWTCGIDRSAGRLVGGTVGRVFGASRGIVGKESRNFAWIRRRCSSISLRLWTHTAFISCFVACAAASHNILEYAHVRA
eukprot:scaffold319289_cov28-Tisochrysis_lutea.AAC.1